MFRVYPDKLRAGLLVCVLCAAAVACAQNTPAPTTTTPAPETSSGIAEGIFPIPPDSKLNVQQQVTVTASRTPLSTEATASSVREVSAEQMEEEPGFALDDRLRQVPGLELYRRTSSWVQNPTTAGISLRGLGSTAASRTLVLSDEVPMTDAFGNWIHWDEIPVLAIESVEVLRGGASDLYGSSAIGGVINEVPVRAVGSRAGFDTGVGGQGTRFGDGLWTGGNAMLRGLAAASFLHTNGYITTTPAARGTVDTAMGVHDETGRVELRHGTAEHSIFLRGNVMNEARANGTPATLNGTRLWRYQSGFDEPLAHAGRVFLRLYGADQDYRQTFSTIAANRNSESLNRFQKVPVQELGGSAQWAQTFAGLTFVAGADVRDVRATDAETTFASGVAGPTTTISARQRDAGVYGEVLWNHGGWSAALSGRVDNFQTFDNKKILSGVTTALPLTDETVADPRLGLVRRLGERVSVTASTFRAFRGPTMNELYRNGQVGSQLTLANNSLLSERATGAEAGVETNVARWGTLRGSYFWTEVNRPITALLVTQTATSQTLQRENLGQIRSRGLSLDFVLRPAAWMEMSGGYQLAVATVTQFAPQPALVGLWIPEVARNAATAQMRFSKRQIGTLNVIARNSGRVYDDTNNQMPLSGFFRLDVEGERAIAKGFTVYASAQNLLDRQIQAGRTPVLTLATPRTATIGIRWKMQ